jgi:hypothetical protein
MVLSLSLSLTLLLLRPSLLLHHSLQFPLPTLVRMRVKARVRTALVRTTLVRMALVRTALVRTAAVRAAMPLHLPRPNKPRQLLIILLHLHALQTLHPQTLMVLMMDKLLHSQLAPVSTVALRQHLRPQHLQVEALLHPQPLRLHALLFLKTLAV